MPFYSNFTKKPSKITVYTASGNWTKPSRLSGIFVILSGGGGGGAGKYAPGFSGGTGGDGAIGVSYIPASLIPGPQTITVGSGGAGGPAPATTPSYTAGSDGGNSSFGSIVTAGGGTGAPGISSGNRGTVSNATFDYSTAPGVSMASIGYYPTAIGIGGAVSSTSGAPVTGYAGNSGIVIIEEYYN